MRGINEHVLWYMFVHDYTLLTTIYLTLLYCDTEAASNVNMSAS